MPVTEALLFEVENVTFRARAVPQIEQDITDQLGLVVRSQWLRRELDSRTLVPAGWVVDRLEPDGWGQIYCRLRSTLAPEHVEGTGPDNESALVSARLSLEVYGASP